jgi:hypothetical protein
MTFYPWTEAHVDRITAALGLPASASGDDVATAVRMCTKRCEELEHKLIAFQDSHQPSDRALELRVAELEAVISKFK